MGISFVLLFWAVIGTVLSGVALVFLGGATALLTRGVTNGRRVAITAASLFPFACLAWAGSIFIFQALVNEGLLHRDPGLGDSWHCPLPNGYEILMIDVTDNGWVYNPRTQRTASAVGDQEDAVPGVRLLQVAGPYLLGATDTKAFENSEKGTNQIDSYFVLDARSGKRTTLQDYEALRGAALQSGIRLNLEPILAVYSRYRFSWFDLFVGILFCGPVVLSFIFLVRWIVHLRRMRRPAVQSA